MRYPAPLQAIVDDLATLPERDLRLEYLLELGGRFQEVAPHIARRPFDPKHRVPACESDAYVWIEEDAARNGTVQLHFAVENPQGISARALATILRESLSGRPARDLLQIDESLVSEVFGSGLSMGKGEGLMGIIRMMKALAATIVARTDQAERPSTDE